MRTVSLWAIAVIFCCNASAKSLLNALTGSASAEALLQLLERSPEGLVLDSGIDLGSADVPVPECGLDQP
jgi:hypothetical protein